MVITAITGGIGSGKSFVCDLLCKQGFKVYDCDSEARRLIRESRPLQQALSKLVGKELFSGEQFDKQALKAFITTCEENAQKVSGIVHPAVAEDFIHSGCEWLESAILFESGFSKRIKVDKVICVTAPLEVRINRIMKRDGCTREQALQWIEAQMSQEEKAKLSDYIIENDGIKDIKQQLKTIF